MPDGLIKIGNHDTMIYIYQVGEKFIKRKFKVTGLDYRLVGLQQCSQWENVKIANTWKRSVLEKYPNAKLIKAKLVVELVN